MTSISRLISQCPKCGSLLDDVRVVRYGQPFRCPACQTELVVPKSYLFVGFWISMALALSLSFAIGLKGIGLLLGLLGFLFPTMFSVGILLRKLWPPKWSSIETPIQYTREPATACCFSWNRSRRKFPS